MINYLADISIIIPIFNAQETLRECIESVLKQSFGNFEMLLIDNNSTDGSLAICREYVQSDVKIQCLSCIERGVSAARNLGIDNAHGRFITFVDADDVLYPNYLEKLYLCMEQFGADMILPRVIRFASSDEKIAPQTKLQTVTYDGADIALAFARGLFEYRFFQVFKLYSTDIINKFQIRFDSDCSMGEDLIFNLSYLHHCKSCVTCEDAVYFYRYALHNRKSLSRRYRHDMLTAKKRVCLAVREYLTESGIFNEFLDEYYTICLNDIYACVVNAFRPEQKNQRAELSAILSDNLFIELSQYNFNHCLPLRKRFFLKLASLNHFTLIAILVKLTIFLNLA